MWLITRPCATVNKETGSGKKVSQAISSFLSYNVDSTECSESSFRACITYYRLKTYHNYYNTEAAFRYLLDAFSDSLEAIMVWY